MPATRSPLTAPGHIPEIVGGHGGEKRRRAGEGEVKVSNQASKRTVWRTSHSQHARTHTLG